MVIVILIFADCGMLMVLVIVLVDLFDAVMQSARLRAELAGRSITTFVMI